MIDAELAELLDWTPTWAYHATTREVLDQVMAEGLTARPQAHPDEARCLGPEEPALFFSPDAELARTWNDVVLRFPWPADAEEDGYGDTVFVGEHVIHSSWFSRTSVPPHLITIEEK